ncbi:ABC transporter ATP-binding protein [Luteolibacter yonseiensis]|uniref:ABC transporter ATP-binding protein n=1 Tax=Luteolibacter yonseiensis TaxID=1144680 RepID=A0A934R3B5_9BACT|nr:ABC transporter ATP-binding protein [Luteolibacter yonseiensis]MBK1814525.1 ABC transporter ATP-binding protein [Luteolibacter yonseiensis]
MAASQSDTPKTAPFVLLWKQMRGFRGKYAWAIAALFLFTAINYVAPLVASATIDFALSGKPDDSRPITWIIGLMGGADFVRERLWFPALLMVLLTVIAGGFSYLKGRFAAEASDGIARRLKDRLYDHLQRLPARYHDRAETGDLIQRCTSDVETLRMALAAQVVEVSNAVLLLLTALPVMVMLDGRMTLVSFALVVPIILFGYIYIGKVKHLFAEVAESEGQVTRVVQENLTGLRVVRAFARQDFEIDKFAAPNKLYRDRSLKLLHLMAWYWSASDLIVVTQQGIVLFTGACFISQGSLTVGTLFAFLMFLNMLLWPVRQMGRTLTDLGKSVVALNRMGEILSEPEESVPAGFVRPSSPAAGKIEVRDLVFGHGEENAAINGISFTVEPGETLAILGPSGSGKSTIMHLLLRLYDHTSGSIRFDGRELTELDRQWVRSQFSVVMQEPFLFSKTIGDNIRLGRGGAEAEQIHEAALLADIHDTIKGFPSGYSTLVGERGITLSGGQRQRVALARALLQDTPVLMLDDALSAVDAETEATILEALRSRHGRRTTLVIAHRLSTLAHADKVIVLEKGRIIQHGTHAELAAREGLYRRLWTIQNALENEMSQDTAP